MSIIKRTKANFGVVPRETMANPNLSLKAKGLLAYLICMPDDWQIYVSQLSTVHKESKNTIAKIIKELIEHGYVTREQKRGEGNRFAGYDYSVYDIPVTQNTVSQKPVSQKAGHGKMVTTNKDYTKKDNTKKESKSAALDLPFSSSEFTEAWALFVQHRKEKRIKLTDTAVKLQFKDFKEWGEDRAIKAIYYSVKKGWTGIFEEKKEAKKDPKEIDWKAVHSSPLY